MPPTAAGVQKAALGVRVVTVDPSLAAQNGLAVDAGVLIADVTPGGPAARAGLKAGDTVFVQVYRGSQQQTIQVTLGELQIGLPLPGFCTSLLTYGFAYFTTTDATM